MIAALFVFVAVTFALAWHASDTISALRAENARLHSDINHLHAVRACDTTKAVEYVPASMREVKADRWAPL